MWPTISGLAATAACGVSMAGMVWGLVANERTYRERQRMLDAVIARSREEIYRGGDWMRWFKLYDVVTRDAHYRARLMFRDPWKLYPRPLRALLTTQKSLEEDMRMFRQIADAAVERA